MTEIIFDIEDAGEVGYTAPAPGHSVSTQAQPMNDLRGNMRDAVRCHFDEDTGRRVIRLHFVRDEIPAV